jgi:hypothetical protein
MAGVLKSQKSTYEFCLDDLKKLIAQELCVDERTIHVEFVIEEVGEDPMDRFPGHKQVTSARVTVEHGVRGIFDR